MIHVSRDHKNPPKILTGKGCQKKIKALLEGSTKRKFSKHYYANKSVRKTLYAKYHDKCAYCESAPGPTSELRIDHYRPKSEVKGEPSHPGYYWLAYEWSNLLPACDKCNTAKLSSFPIAPTGKRVMNPVVYDDGGQLKLNREECLVDSKTLKAEKPFLLHPEIDEPEKHLDFLPDGKIEGKSGRGKWTIKLCDLNREKLVLARKKVIDDFSNQIAGLLLDLIEFKKAEAREVIEFLLKKLLYILFKLREPANPYSRLGWFMFELFEEFFLMELGEKQQQFLREVYESVRETHH
jgi:hypothetical protein